MQRHEKKQFDLSMQKIAAIVITHNPDKNLNQRIERIVNQVAYTIVVDNGSFFPIDPLLQNFVVSRKLEIIKNNYNAGIAKALNQGLSRAKELKFSQALTLDEDTIIDADMVDNLISIYREYPFKEQIGIIGSNARSKNSGKLFKKCKDERKNFIETKTIVTTGSLMSLSAYECVGPFRNDFFIEGVDLEYCLRLRKHGFKVLFFCQPLMTCSGGGGEVHKFFGRTVLVDNHAPWRYYYRIKNLIKIIRAYFWQEPSWIFLAILNYFKMFAKIVLYENNRLAKISSILRGIRDSFK